MKTEISKNENVKLSAYAAAIIMLILTSLLLLQGCKRKEAVLPILPCAHTTVMGVCNSLGAVTNIGIVTVK